MTELRSKRGDLEIIAAKDFLNKSLFERKFSPLTRQVIEETLEMCHTAWRRRRRDEKFDDLMGRLQSRREWIEKLLKRDEEMQEERESFRQLKLKNLLYRYDDFIANRTLDIPREALAGNHSAAIGFKGQEWTEVRKQIIKEEADFAKDNTASRPLRKVLEEVAFRMCVDFKDIISTIDEYCLRNSLGHKSQIKEYIEKRRWYCLAKELVKDKVDLEVVLPEEEATKTEIFRTAIQSIEDEYFDLISQRVDRSSLFIKKVDVPLVILKDEILQVERKLRFETGRRRKDSDRSRG